MKLGIFFIFLMTVFSLSGQTLFDTHFEHKTMRVDYFHTGNAESEHFAVDEIICDGPWSGNSTLLNDPMDLGPYRLVILNKSDKKELFSEGFASIFGEWQTIPEARTQWGTFHESVRFPWPKAPVILRIDKRDNQNLFQPVWQREIDPSYRQINPSKPDSPYKNFTIWGDDDPEHRLDIVVLGDGYTEPEMEKFRSDAKRLADTLLNTEPYRSMKSRLSIRGVETPAHQSGVTRPHDGIFRASPLSVRYSAFDSRRYALTTNNKAVRDAAATVPYDFTIILMNERTYGGGGIYKLYATVAADNFFSDYITVHEMGHHLAALADEYYNSAVSYNTEAPITVEPWEKNITAYIDGQFKWSDQIRKGTPLPTPWDKENFDEFGKQVESERERLRVSGAPESDLEKLFVEQRQTEQDMFAKMKYRNRIGLFEGACYHSKGYYRSSVDCIMFTRSMQFCPVCQLTLAQVIDQYCR